MAKSPKTFERYNLNWPADTDPLQLEFWMLRKGDEWLKQQGRSLFFHFRAAFSLIWETDDHQRWSDLILKTYCENEITVLIGCSNANKTWTMSKIALVDYWSQADKTLWMVSTTEGRGSELRIWGVIKDLFNRAKTRYPELPGKPLDYIKTITTDSLDPDKEMARSIRRGIIVIPCFPSGTLVDTPVGKIKIENLKIGDSVFHAAGVGKIKQTHSRIAERLVRIFLSDGRTIDCTEEHPFFTNKGWIKAIDIQSQTELISTHEAMQILLQAIPTIGTKGGFLFKELRREVAVDTAAFFKSDERQNLRRAWRKGEGFDHVESSREKSKGGQGQGTGWKNPICQRDKGLDKTARNESKSFRKQWKRMPTVQSRTTDNRSSSSTGIQSNDSFPQKTQGWISTLLQAGLRCFGFKAGNRNRRRDSHPEKANLEGHPEGINSERIRVESVEILKRTGDKRYSEREGGYTVHNIEVEGHPSYSVNSFLVHNCKTGGLASGLAPFIGIHVPRLRHAGDEVAVMTDSFLNAYSNWFGNEDFKGIMSGNFMETDDPLGIASEPEDGWDSFHDTGKTQTWRGKFYNAAVVALDGRDSPNFDFPADQKPRYPYLIGRKKLDGTIATHGMDSWQYWSQCVGKPVKGMDLWRVIRKDWAIRHKATEEVVWSGKPLTSIYAVDPAYGSGDRCVGRRLDYGESVDKQQILRISEPEIIPIRRNDKFEPEEQITAFIKNRLEQLDIPASHCFYDSFGRGTLGFEFAKLFGGICPVPVNSGAQPTNRPVRFDLFIEEKGGRKRLKRCDEHYKKFITEMWFSVSECIDSEQLRNLDADTLREGCSRKFTRDNDKIEIENKEDMKARLGKSPDFFDCLAVGLEGARRLGFKIQRAGSNLIVSNKPDWLTKHVKDYQETMKDRQLTNDHT